MNATLHSTAMHIGPFYRRDLDLSRDFGGMAIDERGSSDEGCRIPIWKHVLDALLLLVSIPVIIPCMILVALWIALVSRGPVMVRQERIGRNRRCFPMYRFRTTKIGVSDATEQRHFGDLVRAGSPLLKLDLVRDARLIPGGRLLRASGLDELPQIINILWGDMSWVGPRPCLPSELCYFTAIQRRRFEVLPGLTGLFQIKGRGLSTFVEMNAMDASYVRHCSPWLDLKILFHTPGVLMRQVLGVMKNSGLGEATHISESE
jgi:lipopolysaccharide/colanic/teichoic acid biosynthesis glycosyltransferase